MTYNEAVFIEKPGLLKRVTSRLPELGRYEVLVRIEYTVMSPEDFLPYYEEQGNYPCRVTGKCSGIVEKTGKDVKGFVAGDGVVISIPDKCTDCMAYDEIAKRCGYDRPQEHQCYLQSALSRYIVCQELFLHKLPSKFDMSIAALSETLASALHSIRRVSYGSPPKRVLVIGARFRGLALIACCKMLGVKEIIVADCSAQWLYSALERGADTAINTTRYSIQKAMICCREPWKPGETVFLTIEGKEAWSVAVGVAGYGGTVVRVLRKGAELVDADKIYQQNISLISIGNYEKEIDTVIEALANGKLHFSDIITKRFLFDECEKGFSYALRERDALFCIGFHPNKQTE